MLRENWFDHRVHGVFVGHVPSVVLEVRVTCKVEVFLVLSQRDNCDLPPDDPDAHYKSFLINVACYSPKEGRHVVCANSGPDPTVTFPDSYTFVADRDVGMEMVFLPEYSPYYVIPRVMDNQAGELKTFTVGLLSPHKAGECCLQVRFLRLPETHEALSDAPQYTMEGAEEQCAEFQCRAPGQPPTHHFGDNMQEAETLRPPWAEEKEPFTPDAVPRVRACSWC